MIVFGEEHLLTDIKSIWKVCFGDTDRFIELFFRDKYKPTNTLVYCVDDKAVACLQMQEYKMRFYGQIVSTYYLVGLSTLPEHRAKGYMRSLIEKSFEVMKDRTIPLAILIPAEDSLVNYYNQFDFEETFEKGFEEIQLRDIVENSINITEAFKYFDNKYQQTDFCVLKSKSDFETIVEDLKNEEYPPKFNMRAMSKLIDIKQMLSFYASGNKDLEFVIEITNSSYLNNRIFYIKNGLVCETDQNIYKCRYFNVSLRLLTRLLFGFKIDELGRNDYLSFFKLKHPIINLMLE